MKDVEVTLQMKELTVLRKALTKQLPVAPDRDINQRDILERGV